MYFYSIYIFLGVAVTLAEVINNITSNRLVVG